MGAALDEDVFGIYEGYVVEGMLQRRGMAEWPTAGGLGFPGLPAGGCVCETWGFRGADERNGECRSGGAQGSGAFSTGFAGPRAY